MLPHGLGLATAQNSCGRDPGTLPLLSQSKHRYATLRKAASAGHPGNVGLALQVRDVRVLYELKDRDYKGFVRHQFPQPHEYFCPMAALTAERSHEDPDMTALIARASATVNFMTPP